MRVRVCEPMIRRVVGTAAYLEEPMIKAGGLVGEEGGVRAIVEPWMIIAVADEASERVDPAMVMGELPG